MTASGRRISRAAALGLGLWVTCPGLAAGLELFPAAEVREAHELRLRILAEVPQLDPRHLRERPRLPPETLAQVQQRLLALQARETDNPFFHWAQGELMRQGQDPAGGAAAFERARQVAGPRFLVRWLLWQEYLGRDLWEEVQREERALQAIQVTWGLARFPLLTDELMRRGTEVAEGGDLARALVLYDAAVANTPESPEALFGRASLTWQADKTRLLSAGRDLVRGMYHTLRSTPTRFRVTGNLLLSLLVAFLVVLVLVAALRAVRIQPLFGHDLRERVLSAFPPASQGGLALLCFLLPLLVGLGLLWAAVVALVISAPYMSRRERTVVSGLMAMLALLPLGYERVAARHVLAASREFVLVQAAEQGGRGETLVQHLSRWAQEAPNSGLPHYSLGLALKRRGELPLAEAEMAQAAHLLPRAAFVHVGLGNLQYLGGRLAEAEESYRRAADLAPGSAAAQMNLFTLYTQRLQLDRSEEAQRKSLALDPHMVRTLSHFHGQGLTGVVVDEPVPWDDLVAGLAFRTGEVKAVAEGLWGMPLRGVRLRQLPVVALALLVLFWFYGTLRGRSSPVRRCQQCGEAFCRRCQPHPKEKDYCSPCAAAFRPREGVAAFVRARRMRAGEDWARRERIRVRLLGNLVPGGRDLYRGHLIRGLLLCLPAVWLLLEGLLLDVLTPTFRFAVPLPGQVRWAGVLVLLAALYAWSVWRRGAPAGAAG